jgi:integrase
MARKKGMKLRSWGTLCRLPPGNWRASYIGPDLARHAAPITYTTKMDADYWLTSERRLIERGEWNSTQNAHRGNGRQVKNVREYATDWPATRTLKPRTNIGYEALFKNHIVPSWVTCCCRHCRLKLRRWYAGLGTEHTTRNAHAYRLLHSICATAVSDGLLTTQPCQIARAMQAPTTRQTVILDVEDVAKLANTVQPERLKALILVSAWCGLRWGEVIELRRKDMHRIALSSRSAEVSLTGRSSATSAHRRAVKVVRSMSHRTSAQTWPSTLRTTLPKMLTRNCFWLHAVAVT